MKKFLTIASIFSGISILFFFFIGAYIPMFIEVGITMFYLYLVSDNMTKNNRLFLLISAIINLFFSSISSIFALIAYSESNKDIKVKVLTEEEKKNRRILFILNVGTFMVILSGFVFITTSKNYFSDFTKTLFLFLGSILFAFLYFFTNKRLNMNFSSKIYYLISLIFLGFTYYSIGNFELFGTYFSIHGRGSDLFLASNFIVDAVLCGLLYMEYSNKTVLYAIYSFLILSLFYFMNFFHIEYFHMITIFTVLLSLIHFFKFSNDTLYYGYGFLLFLICFSIMNLVINNPILLVIVLLLQILNLFLFLKKFDTTFSRFITIIFIPACILNFSLKITSNFDLVVSVLIPCLSLFYIYTIISKTFNKEKEVSTFMMIFINFIFLIFYLIASGMNISTFLIVSLSILLTNYGYFIFRKEKSFEYYVDPIKKILFILSCLHAISSFIYLSSTLSLSILIFMMFIIFITIKEKTLKNFYFAILICLFIFATILNLSIFHYSSMFVLTISIIGFYFVLEREDNYKYFRYPFYVFMLYMIYYYFTNVPVLKEYFMGYTLIFCLYGLFMWFYKSKKKYYVITSLMMALPMYGLITSSIHNQDITKIIINLIGFYFLWIVKENLIQKEDDKIVITDMVTIALLSMVVFTDNILLSIYGGIISFILLSIGFSSEKHEHLFTISVVVTIVNIIVSFKDLWLSFSLWFYLLIIGISMIGFATYREIKK